MLEDSEKIYQEIPDPKKIRKSSSSSSSSTTVEELYDDAQVVTRRSKKKSANLGTQGFVHKTRSYNANQPNEKFEIT